MCHNCKWSQFKSKLRLMTTFTRMRYGCLLIRCLASYFKSHEISGIVYYFKMAKRSRQNDKTSDRNTMFYGAMPDLAQNLSEEA